MGLYKERLKHTQILWISRKTLWQFDLWQTLYFEFYNFLIAAKQITFETIFKLDDNFLLKIIPVLRDFIEEALSSDQVFWKNIDLLNTAENIISHYTAEQTRNLYLRTATLK